MSDAGQIKRSDAPADRELLAEIVGTARCLFQPCRRSLPERLRESLDGFFDVGAAVEGAESEVALASGAESAAGCTDEVALFEQRVEEVPAGRSARSFQPDVRCVDSAVNFDADLRQTFAQQASVLHVEADQLTDLLLAGFAVRRCGSALNRVRNAVELRAVTTVPQRVNVDGLAAACRSFETLWYDCERTASSREASVLAEAAELDRDVACSFDFVDRVWNLRISDEGLVRSVEQNDRVVRLRVIDPLLERFLRGDRPRRVVRKAQVDQVDFAFGQRRSEIVFGRHRNVNQAGLTAIGVGFARAACHHVRVDINRVDRVRDGDGVVRSEDVQNVSGVALRSVRNEDFIR